MEFAKAILPLVILHWRRFLKYHLGRTFNNILQNDFIVPVALNIVKYSWWLWSTFSLADNLPCYFTLFVGEPATHVECHKALLVGVFEVCDYHLVADVGVRLAHIKVVHRHNRRYYLKSLIPFCQVKISPKFLIHWYAFTIEVQFNTIIILNFIVFALNVTSGDWWMVTHLFSKALVIICNILISLAKYRIKWFVHHEFTHAQSGNKVSRDEGHSLHWILLLGCFSHNVLILKAVCWFLC